MSLPYFERMKAVKHFVFDVDGVFTDNQLLLTENGHLLRSMNTRDGFAVKTALRKGYSVSVITGGSSDGVRKRLSKLGISNIHSGIDDKKMAFGELLERENWKLEEILYMGDDFPDLPVLKLVGCACCPKDAEPEVRNFCHFVASKKGGSGCVREVIEKVLILNNDWLSSTS